MTNVVPFMGEDYLPMMIEKLDRVMREHVGRENAIGRDALLRKLREEDPHFPDRDMRKLIERFMPWTCSLGNGYFIAKDDVEAALVVKYHESYIIAHARRRKAILVAYPNAGQMEFNWEQPQRR